MSQLLIQLLVILPLAAVVALSPSTTPPEWLAGRLADFDLEIYDFPDTGRGLKTTRDRKEGEVLVKVPEKDALTASVILDRFPLLDQAAKSSIETREIQLTDEQVLAVGLLLLKQDKDRYASSLPPQQSVLQIPEPLISFLPVAYQKLIVAYRQHCEKLRASIVEFLPDDVATKLVTPQDFAWAFATVRSRCVGMDGDDDPRVRTGGKDEIRVMLPGFDLLNHKFGAVTSPGFHEEEQHYFVKSNDPYAADEQVFISYSDQRDNLKMLMTFGFVAPGNPEQIVNLDVEDLFRALAVARPAYFQPAVLQQLWGLIKKLGKERDLYEWNGRTKKPDELLLNGIDMMADIEKQFLKEPDTTFGKDILACMIANRRQELAHGIERLNQAMEGMEDKTWIPMMSSMKLLMQEEDRYLSDAEGCDAKETS